MLFINVPDELVQRFDELVCGSDVERALRVMTEKHGAEAALTVQEAWVDWLSVSTFSTARGDRR